MDVAELKAHIQSGLFKSFYIMAGVEWKVQRLYIDQIAKVSGREVKYLDSIADIYAKSGNITFIKKSYVYVVRDDKDLITNEKLQGQIEKVSGDNIIILLLTVVDKRTKFYKTFKDGIIEFEPLKPEILKKYIQREINLSDKNCEKLMEVCEYDYGRCLLEIDKIKQYAKGFAGDYGPDNFFSMLLDAGVIYQPPKDAIFDFVDAVLDRNVNKAFDLYSQCVAVGEATMVMLTVLYNNTKALLQVQSFDGADLAKSTGLNQYQIFGAKKHLKRYRNGELVFIMRLCQQCQMAIVTGTMEEEYVMEYILCQIL